jgi:serine/threonine protein kinase/Tol biopolymer transport system component
MTLHVGNVLYNRYRIDEVLAQGGMGAIYRAYDQSLGVQIALKENLFETEESTRQFRREATLLAGLRHPNLPRVTDHFTIANQGQYLVMDFIEGQDLRQRMTSGNALREDEVITIGAVVCEALQYLHTRKPPIVHRDIKPGNVKVTPAGQVFLVDFGLAKVATPGQATTTGAQALTPGYAPPEQYGQGTTPLSDIYALGATLYAVLTGKIPEDGLARAMGTTQLTPLRKHNPKISERTAQVVEKAMEVRPEDRFQSAEEFRLALLNSPTVSLAAKPRPLVLTPVNVGDPTTVRKDGGQTTPSTQHFPTVATPIAPPPPTYPPVGPVPTPAKRRFPLGWVIGIAALLLVAIGAFVILSNRPTPPALPSPSATPAPTQADSPTVAPSPTSLPLVATQAPSNTPLPSPTPTLQATATVTATPKPTATFTPAATPLGGSGQIAFASIRAGRRPQIWLANTDGSNPHALTDLGDGACQPSWAPDGKKLVFVTPCSQQQQEYPGSTLFLVNADGTNPEPLPSLPGGDFDPAWSPDGTRILFTSLREGVAHIFAMNLADRKVERITGAFSDDRRGAWSADGKRIAFESTRLGARQIWTMGPKGENQAEFTRLAEGAAFNPVWSADGAILYYNRDAALPMLFARRTDTAGLGTETRVTDIRPVLVPRISSDGQWIAFESWTGSNHDIIIIRVSGTSRQSVTNDANFDFDAAWKP